MRKLSVYIVTLNEEMRLSRTLEAASKVADEIVIVDSGSTDKTEEIAKKYKCKFVFHKWKNISSQKNFAQNLCENDFVLSLDADEVLSSDLIGEINKSKKEDYKAYRIKIKDIYQNQNKPSFFAKSYNLIRLYDRHFSHMPDDLTNDRVVLGEGVEVKQLNGLVHHYSYVRLTQVTNKLNIYSDELLKTYLEQGKKYSKWRLSIEMPYQFVRYYFFKGKFLNGWFGFIDSMSLSYFRFLKIAKWIEYQEMNRKKND